MKKFQKYFLLFSLPFMACTTTKIAQEQQEEDNVYVSRARAIEGSPYIQQVMEKYEKSAESNYKTEAEVYGDDRMGDSYDNYRDDYYDGMSYGSRIYRFHNYSPWRNYYDPYYDYRFDAFGYNRSYYDGFYYRNSPSWSFNIFVGPSYGAFYPYNYNPYYFNPWGYNYSPYHNNYWGIYSYYNTAPNYPAYYGNGNYPAYGRPGNYRPRPSRGTENSNPYTNNGDQNGYGSRADRYIDRSPSVMGRSGDAVRPARSQNQNSNSDANTERSRTNTSSDQNRSNSGQSRPTRTEQYTPPPAQSSAPAKNNDSRNDSSPRPSRTGGR